MNTKNRILVIEDDKQIRKLMMTSLKSNGYDVECVSTGEAGILALTGQKTDIILLDLGLPDMDGVALIKEVREWCQAPIIVVSARGEDADKIAALDSGADDYLTKPFSLDELMARIRVAQRRIINAESADDGGMEFTNGNLFIDYAAGVAYLDNKELSLTPMEYKLLCLLSRNVGKVLTYTFITGQIWGNSLDSDVATLRVFMASLRKKIEKDTAHPEYIQTHIGTGYRMLKL